MRTRKPARFVDSNAPWHLVTVVSWRRRPILGAIHGGEFDASPLGLLAADAFEWTASGPMCIGIEALQVMPDHLHIVLHLGSRSGAVRRFVNLSKGRATRLARREGHLADATNLWQRGFHTSPLRTVEAVARAVAYVRDNPVRAADGSS